MMRSSFSLLVVFTMLLSMIAALSMVVMPASAQAHTIAAISRNASTGHVTVIVLDMSGSMSENDPDGLRCSAANAYIDLSQPGDFIGVIGLDNNNNARGGPHNFQSAQVWAQPTEMATHSDRQMLRQVIAQKSNNCRPDNTTPTYDSLKQALSMLNSATQDQHISGSVILLTDGVPDPDTQSQIDATKHDLLPQFKEHNWPVDTIALGKDTSFHGFLTGVADATSGKFYDDGKGVVPGVSTLNIAPFFVDIFARRNGRTVGPTVEPTSISGGTTRREFPLGNFVDHLDVIVVKDQPGMMVRLTAPNGQKLPPAVAGMFISTDPHYAIFSIDGPQPGAWIVGINGPGQFLMNSLTVSRLRVAITLPTASSVLPVDQEFTIAATVKDKDGNPISGGRFNMTGSMDYASDSTKFKRPLVLSDNGTGLYSVKVVVPQEAPPGSYEIKISASQESDTPIASDDQTVRIERFPLPFFLTKTGQPTENIVTSTALRWDPALEFLYSLSPIQWLGQRPPLVNYLPSQPYGSVAGLIMSHGKPYSEATVTATATGSYTSMPVTVVNDGNGHFLVLFPLSATGAYTVTFRTSGTFEDSHGDFGVTSRIVRLSTESTTLMQEVTAWMISLILLVFAPVFVVLFIRLWCLPAPNAQYESLTAQTRVPHRFNKRRSPLMILWQRNLLPSKPTFGKPGLQLLVPKQGKIQVRARGNNGSHWFDEAGRSLSRNFKPVNGITYSPAGRPEIDTRAEKYRFIVNSRASKQGSPRKPKPKPHRKTGSGKSNSKSRYTYHGI
jgi:hypothetical protein